MSAAAEKKVVKANAEGQLESLVEYRRVLHEQHAHAFRWLSASILAINAGAAVSVLNVSQLQASTKIEAGVFFCVGIILALSMAFVAQVGIGATLQPLHRQMSYWKNVSTIGARDHEEEVRLAPGLNVANKFNAFGQVIGFLAVVSFVVGVWKIGDGIQTGSQPRVPSDKAQLIGSRPQLAPQP